MYQYLQSLCRRSIYPVSSQVVKKDKHSSQDLMTTTNLRADKALLLNTCRRSL